ncbi:hypothetical protein SAMN05421736_12646 [Evansella caseinilytica]|uniref:Heparinase II/III-like protein n=1 Tax=Evansella caseinilytica TaxID=1503961 RepID=A0A1H3UTU2_9BACI|nr:hypothetical protein [Evansella caseinilytica]SDZ65832.1 hypothetical protein SAMN05421736_12646 [Evansella caseinilytica]
MQRQITKMRVMILYDKIVRLNDQLTESFFEKQVADEQSSYAGGIIDEKTGIPSPSHVGTASVIAGWICAYVNPDSAFFRSDSLKARLNKALEYMLTEQHADGTISPGWTNYHSPPDTAFIVTGFVQIYMLLEKQNVRSLLDIQNKILLFLERAVPAMLTGGCHTPNHRWVLTSALAHLYDIFQKQELADRAEAWLREGIDMTEDGEWTERSNGIYNSVSNILLYHTARLLNKEELLLYVRKNLEMMTYLVHPNGEVVTDYSGRQDFGVKYNLSPYHLVYCLLAVHDNNPSFAAMATLAAASLTEMGPVNNHVMLGYLLFPEIKKLTVDDGKGSLPTNYEVIMNENHPVASKLKKLETVGHQGKIAHSSLHTSFGTPVVRYRKEDVSGTLMCRTPSFFSLRYGDAGLLGIQLFTSFTPGLVDMDSLKKENDGYLLEKKMEKGYYGPIPDRYLTESPDLRPPTTSTWYLLPHQHRKTTHNQLHIVQIRVIPGDDQWQLQVQSDERKDVFTQLVFIFDINGELSGEGITEIEESCYFWKQGKLTFSQGREQLILASGAHEHWLEEIQQTAGQTIGRQKCKAVKVNLVTPFDKTFRIQWRRQ